MRVSAVIGFIIFLFHFSNAQNAANPAFENDFKLLEKYISEGAQEYTAQFLNVEQNVKQNGNQKDLARLYLIHTRYLDNTDKLDSLVALLHWLRTMQRGLDQTERANIYLDLAFAFDRVGNYDSLHFWSSQAADLIDADSPLYGKFLVAESFKSKFDGDYLKSVDFLLQAIKIFEARNESESLSSSYISIAHFYGRLGDLKNQEEALLKALEVKSISEDKIGRIAVYNNLGVCLKNQNKLAEALTYYNLAFEILEVMNSPIPIAQNLTNRANIHELLKDYAKAEQLFLACEEVCHTHNIKYGEMLVDLNLGNLYRQMKRFSQAKERLDSALLLSKALKTKREQYLSLERMAWLERDRGNFEQAYQYLADYQVLRDSVVNESVKKEALDLKEKYESEKKENIIISLSKDKLYQKFVIALLVLSVLVLVFSYLWVMNKNRLIRQEKQEEAQRLQFELELKEKELLTDAIRRMSIMHTKEALAKELKELIQDLPKVHAQKFAMIKRELTKSTDESLLDEFETRFLGVYESFFERLKERAPDLTPTELRTAALIRLNFTSKEIATITNRTVGTIDNLRSSIRRKMALGEDEHLTQKLLDI